MCFSFELSWLRQEGFYNMMAVEWDVVSYGNSATNIWQIKLDIFADSLEHGQKILGVNIKREGILWLQLMS
jgi:hypothetical protein